MIGKFHLSSSLLKGCFCAILMLFLLMAAAQESSSVGSTKQPTQTVIAGKEYERSGIHNWFWGHHYRKDWITSVRVQSLLLDTAAGGLKPYEAGGGRQTKTLKLRNSNGKEYVLRSIDKDFGKSLLPIYQETFLSRIAKDQVSIAPPYAALTIPQMASAAKIYHTNPKVIYLPRQSSLDSFNTEFGDDLYLFEQRPDGNWEEASNFGNSKNIISTEDLLEKLLSDNNAKVDQREFIKARLFDMFIGDWGRHEDQWRWAEFEDAGQVVYRPIPRDRDQAYTKFDGSLMKFTLSAAEMSYLQSFDSKIKDVNKFNFQARNLDRRMANEMVLSDWIAAAKDLQGALTDKVIESSIKQMPPETFSISGNEIISKLKSRRSLLHEYAEQYYKFLAGEVDIPGTSGKEFFEVIRLSDDETTVKLFKIDQDGNVSNIPFYSRKFNPDETREIRIYGIANNDIYHIDGEVQKGILVRLIGGKDKDIYADKSSAHGHKAFIYDDHQNEIITSRETVLELSADTAGKIYKYDAFTYNKSGFKPELFYDNPDRLYVGLGYKWTHHKWRRTPFASMHGIHARYSISQQAFSFTYEGKVNQFIGKWNLEMNGTYDLVRWTNFFGLGNETPEITNNRDYYRMRSKEIIAKIGFARQFGKHVVFRVSPFFQSVDIIKDTGRFVFKEFQDGKNLFVQNQFGGGIVNIAYSYMNHPVIPTKGLTVAAGMEYGRNLEESSRHYTRYSGMIEFYQPFGKHLVAHVRTGAATVVGEPEFYQMNPVGGAWSVRGLRRDRYWGNSSFYSSHELQYLFDMRSSLFNGRAGFLGFYDIGRVWVKGEISNLWHTGYGAGVLIAPFNRFNVAISYGISQQDKLLQLRFNKKI